MVFFKVIFTVNCHLNDPKYSFSKIIEGGYGANQMTFQSIPKTKSPSLRPGCGISQRNRQSCLFTPHGSAKHNLFTSLLGVFGEP